MNEIRTKFRATCSRNLSRQRCVTYAPLRTRMRTRRVFFTPEEFPLRVYNKAFLSLQLRSQITRYARFTREMKNPLRVYALAYKSRKKFRFLSQSENAVLPIAGKRVSTDAYQPICCLVQRINYLKLARSVGKTGTRKIERRWWRQWWWWLAGAGAGSRGSRKTELRGRATQLGEMISTGPAGNSI